MADENTEPATNAGGDTFEATGAETAESGRWRKRDLANRGADARPAGGRAPERSGFEGERVAKAIARAGLGSRRDAEAWIAQGRVAVNGRVLQSPAFNVVEGDAIFVDGKPLAHRERTRLWLFNKPRGLMTTERDPEGRPTVFEALPAELPRVVTVGRLDFNTEGLLLLTNDGGLARVLELPTTGWQRRYRVRANGSIEQARLDALADGITIDEIRYGAIEAVLERQQGANVWLTMSLREGKNREIKRVLEHLGLVVNRLIRVSFGPFQLGELADGAVLEIRTRVLRDQLGETLAREAGADFEAPIRDPRMRESPERRPAREAREDSTIRAIAPGEPKTVRKHVSALRAERTRDQRTGPRKRIERDATSDRRGRTIAVERIRAVANEPDPRTRNGRRFAEQKARAKGTARTGTGRAEARTKDFGKARSPDAFREADGRNRRPRREGAQQLGPEERRSRPVSKFSREGKGGGEGYHKSRRPPPREAGGRTESERVTKARGGSPDRWSRNRPDNGRAEGGGDRRRDDRRGRGGNQSPRPRGGPKGSRPPRFPGKS